MILYRYCHGCVVVCPDDCQEPLRDDCLIYKIFSKLNRGQFENDKSSNGQLGLLRIKFQAGRYIIEHRFNTWAAAIMIWFVDGDIIISHAYASEMHKIVKLSDPNYATEVICAIKNLGFLME